MIKIDRKIVDVAIVDASKKEVEVLSEKTKRPNFLLGSTYKIKTPHSESALYITINDIILNEGTDNEEQRPYEIFINSKDMAHFQWVSVLTLVISACFRKGGDICFLVDELRGVVDPKGGYFKKGGVFMPSLVSEIGLTLDLHLKKVGMIKDTAMDDSRKRFIESKTGYPDSATVCPKCSVKSAILMDGCSTCLNCGDSKCG